MALWATGHGTKDIQRPRAAVAASVYGGNDRAGEDDVARPSMTRSMVGRLLVAAVAAAALASVALLLRVALATPPDLEAACDEGNPYLVTTCYYGLSGRRVGNAWDPYAPAIILFRDTAADRPYFTLATYEQVGTIWGLAYRGSEPALYAAAYHKVQLPFGPGGTGAVYRIDLLSGEVKLFLTVPDAGPDRHTDRAYDEDSGPWVGRTSLGDIELLDDESELFILNLDDRQIHRFAMPSGTPLGAFEHGAVGEPWAAEARSFGLAVRQGAVYHAVVRAAEGSLRRQDLSAHIYRSRPDGSDMREVASFALDYQRGEVYRGGSLAWQPWRDPYGPTAGAFAHYSSNPMPMLTDITFDGQSNMILGFRDRRSDTMPHFRRVIVGNPEDLAVAFGIGDILRGVVDGDEWRIEPAREFYDDRVQWYYDESALGGLAQSVVADHVVTGSYLGERDNYREGVYWYDNATGNKALHERLCDPLSAEPFVALVDLLAPAYAHDEPPRQDYHSVGTVGDVEELCSLPVTARPTPTATPTPSPTPRPSVTPTAASSEVTPAATASPSQVPTRTPIATLVPRELYLPLALREHCDPVHERSDVALVLDTSSSMAGQKLVDAKAAALLFVDMVDLAPGRSQLAVVRFDREAEVVRELTNAPALIEAAIRNLQVRSGTHIDKGLRTALGELQSARHLERNAQVLILLTDGVQTGTPGEELRAAAEVQAGGVLVYAIGLGEDVDDASLHAIAGADDRYYFAPDSGDLARIYGQIARDLMCPGKELWGGR